MNFFKTLIAATLGTLLALALGFFLVIIVVSSSSDQPEPYVRDNTVLKLALSGSLPTQQSTNPLDEILNPDGKDKVSLQSLKENLAKAQSHENIKGIWLEIDFMTEAWANLEEAHDIISAFRDSSEKFIYASTNDVGYNEKGYFLATAADSIFSPPETFFEFDGFYSQVTFFDGLLEKLGVEAEVIRHGKYKGAVEPYYRKELSEDNEYQLNQILEQVNTTFLSAVTNKTGLSAEQLNKLLNSRPRLTSDFGFQSGLIDSLLYPDEVQQQIKQRLKLTDNESLQTISNERYARVSAESAGRSTEDVSDKIAVLYANGPIMPEANTGSPLSNQQFITTGFIEEQLEDIRKDDDIQALVIRINSPGGAGSTSDIIWRKIQEIKEEMPVIVSMGGVAASGGYYIAMAADSIVAEPNTLTGSIGVFATKFNATPFFNEKLGLTFDEVKTHQHADWLNTTNDLTSAEEKALQFYVDEFYQTFIQKVAAAREMTVDQVDEVAQGRVWTGAAAQEIGLIDELGGLEKAFSLAANKAGVTEYGVERYPKPKTFYELILSSAGSQARSFLKSSWLLGPVSADTRNNLSIIRQKGALTLYPFEISIQ